MKKILFLVVLLFFYSCAILKINIPSEKGIKGYNGANVDTINTFAIQNSIRINQFHQNENLDWGLAMSGGGIRSAAFNIGALKALYDINFLDKIDIISSVSGGSYASGWYYSNGILKDPTNMGHALFNEKEILKNICDLQNKGNMLKTPTMASALFLTPKMAFNKYKNGIQRTFLSDSIGQGGINLLQNHILSKSIPQLVINTTVSSKKNNDWLPQVFEYTPFNRGNPEIGFETYNIYEPKPLNEIITISGAALKIKLMHKTPNYSNQIEGKYIPLSDGGHSENLGAISLIRRGVKNIIVIDAEYNNNYSFDGFKMLKKSIKDELGLDLSIPTIDSFISGESQILQTSVHLGTISNIYISPNNIETPSTIKIYYVKMAMPLTIISDINTESVFNTGDSINSSFISSSCEIFGEKNECEIYNSELVNIHPSKLEFNALSVYWVKSYSDWLNNRSNWRHFNYTFPHTTTADQSFYRDQMAAFIGLGYLESLELKEHLTNTTE